jgi:hypothetical protein
MSDETVQPESAETDDSAHSPEVIPDEEAADAQQPAVPAAQPDAAPNPFEAVHSAALDAERAVVESQYSEGLGPSKKPGERKTTIER